MSISTGDTARAAARPILRWAGAKTQILDRLAKYWLAPDAVYIEPFCGSAALFLRIMPAKAVLGDKNEQLIETYRTIRANPERVHKAMAKWERSSETYYLVRALQVGDLSATDRAARFVFLNRLCFNGLFRTNLQGKFNVPWGGERAAEFPTVEQFRAFAEKLTNVRLSNADFETTLRRAKQGDFVYLDPPYCVSQTRVFREYMPSGFGADDLTRLRESILNLDRRGIRFVLSYAESPEAYSLADGFNYITIPVKRFIAGSAKKRRAAQELLITNIGSVI